MITILYGEHTISSYEALQIEKKKYEGKEIAVVNGDTATIAEIEVVLTSNTLFSDEKLVVIEGLLTSRPSKRKDEILEYIAKETETTILLYEDKEAGASLKKIPKAKSTNFKPPQSIFTFVDTINPIQKAKSATLLHELLKSEVSEIIYTMIVRQFRNLILAKINDPRYSGGLPPWMLGKFKRQAQYFTLQGLLINYRKLLDIDYKIKFGLTPLPLPKLLDIFLLTL